MVVISSNEVRPDPNLIFLQLSIYLKWQTIFIKCIKIKIIKSIKEQTHAVLFFFFKKNFFHSENIKFNYQHWTLVCHWTAKSDHVLLINFALSGKIISHNVNIQLKIAIDFNYKLSNAMEASNLYTRSFFSSCGVNL